MIFSDNRKQTRALEQLIRSVPQPGEIHFYVACMICFHDFVQYLDRAGDIKKKLEDRSNGKQVILVPSINVWHASNIKDRIRRVVQSRGLRRMDRHISKLLQTTQTILELACDKSTLVLHMSRIFFCYPSDLLACISKEQRLFNADNKHIFEMLNSIRVLLDRLELVGCALDATLQFISRKESAVSKTLQIYYQRMHTMIEIRG